MGVYRPNKCKRFDMKSFQGCLSSKYKVFKKIYIFAFQVQLTSPYFIMLSDSTVKTPYLFTEV